MEEEASRCSESDRDLAEASKLKVSRGVKKAIVKCKRYELGKSILIDLLLYSGCIIAASPPNRPRPNGRLYHKNMIPSFQSSHLP